MILCLILIGGAVPVSVFAGEDSRSESPDFAEDALTETEPGLQEQAAADSDQETPGAQEQAADPDQEERTQEETGPAADTESGQETGPAADRKSGNETPGNDTPGQEKPAADPVFSQTQTLDGIAVTVSAAAGVFPEGAVLSVARASLPRDDAAAETDSASCVFDIKVLAADGTELQPAEGKTVSISFRAEEAADNGRLARVLRISGDGRTKELPAAADISAGETASAADGAGEKPEAEAAGHSVCVETDQLGLFALEFTADTLPASDSLPQAEQTYTLTVDNGTVTWSRVLPENINVIAIPARIKGYAFVCWTENGAVVSREEQYAFKLTRSRSLKANYVPRGW